MRIRVDRGLGVGVMLLALLMVLAVRPAESARRGRSGLPPGPGNPLAALQEQINGLDARLDAPRGYRQCARRHVDRASRFPVW
ncbi:MAG: hypothetical protein M5R38_08160 [Candidatus Methylomirabilis sp.]|nr:hypothetical protein [Candidatus Methylomirabilis sp.]